MRRRARADEERGFTLIELLVVVVVIAILAAIAIPMFLRNREKAYAAQVQSTLKNAGLAAETAGSEAGGYAALDDNQDLLEENGFNPTESISIGISATATSFCVVAAHDRLPAGVAWWVGSYTNDEGRPAQGVSGEPGCVAALVAAIGPVPTTPEPDVTASPGRSVPPASTPTVTPPPEAPVSSPPAPGETPKEKDKDKEPDPPTPPDPPKKTPKKP